MPNEKVISTIGVNDEDAAHLRLLMRRAASDLTHAWRWGTDTGADLLAVDISNFAGQMARARAKVTGMRVAVVCDADTPTDGDPAFVRPFKLDNVIEVLNQATEATSANLMRAASTVEEFYHDDVSGEPDQAGESGFPFQSDEVPRGSASADVAQGLDEMIRGNPLADPYANLKPARLGSSTTVEETGLSTKRSELRSDREREAQATPLGHSAPTRSPRKPSAADERSAHHLREYLEGDLIAGPVQIAWSGSAVLTLDPKHQVYHCTRSMRDIEAYFRKSPRRDEWRRLTSAEIAQIRETQPAQPYHKLVWLDVVLHSEGKLASGLDPGGTFELTRWMEIARDYPQLARISAALMQPVRLHEIASSCGVEMSQVFDVVNAYDAIGCLKKTPRVSRHAESDQDRQKSSFLQRLRNPFGKS
ncbi:hypothetical protein [Dokdonella sp.]|uniref:hypothetical protein n=1 Tax=Dokdonella sp. TaxID=2291710 RepID=UPI003C6FD195